MPPTPSTWLTEAAAIFKKEWRSELRTKHGLLTSIFFGFLAVVAMAFASFGQKINPGLASGMLYITLLFSAVIALPRTFIAEDEQGTFELLRLISSPSGIFVGKLFYNGFLISLTGVGLAVLFSVLTGCEVQHWAWFIFVILLITVNLALGVSFCGALVMGASNRWLLSTVLSLPFLLPQMALGTGALRITLGEGGFNLLMQYILGMLGFSLAMGAATPALVTSNWQRLVPHCDE